MPAGRADRRRPEARQAVRVGQALWIRVVVPRGWALTTPWDLEQAQPTTRRVDPPAARSTPAGAPESPDPLPSWGRLRLGVSQEASTHLIARPPRAGDRSATSYGPGEPKTGSQQRWANASLVVEIKGYRGEDLEKRRLRWTPNECSAQQPRPARLLDLRRADRDLPDRGRLQGEGGKRIRRDDRPTPRGAA